MKYTSILAASVLAISTPIFAASGELKEQAKKVLQTNSDAIVGLSIIAKTEMGVDGDGPSGVRIGGPGGGKDQKVETTGVIVDPSGLIVGSLSSIGAASLMDGREVETPNGTVRIKTKTDVKEVKVVMPDGTEIPADVVMKDADLDLAFFKVRTDSPEAKDVKFTAVDLNNSTKADILDDVVVLGRMDATMNRQPTAYTSEVLGIVKKPREFLSIQTLRPASPVFSPDGKIVGLSIMRRGTGALSAGAQQPGVPAVLPTKDILKVAAQAKDAKPEKADDGADKKDKTNKDEQDK
jgi:hypothetical protein